MGFELTQGAVFYIVIMMIVIVLGVAIVVKGNPLTLLKQQQFSQMFEPGRLYMDDPSMADLGQRVKIDCSGAYYIVTLDSVSFRYNDRPSDKTSVKKFIIILDYMNMLFTGTIPGSGTDAESTPEITCTATESGEYFNCASEVIINFPLGGKGKGTGALTGKTVLHFTAWESKDALKAAASASGTTLSSLLDAYPEFYVSSFDAVVDASRKCDEFKCEAMSEAECKANEAKACYWSAPWFSRNKCKLCLIEDDCSKYDTEQCAACYYPRLHCKVSLQNCVAVDA